MIYSISSGHDLKLKEKIFLSQEKEIIFRPVSLAVIQDEKIIIPDLKGSNIKIYDKTGQLIKIWGKKGIGPNEVLGPSYIYYDSSNVAFFDLGQMRVFIYQIDKNLDFKLIRTLVSLSGPFDIVLFKERIWIPEYIRDLSQKEFMIYCVDIKSGRYEYILPNSFFSSLIRNKDWPIIGGKYYCLPTEKYLYCVWEGDLHILKWDLNNKIAQFFGEITNNYKKPQVTKSFREARYGPEKSYEKIMKEKRKWSYISGLFGDNDFISLIYHSYDIKSGLWRTFVQFYSEEGKFINEVFLPEAVTYDDTLGRRFYYSKENKLLYFLSQEIDKQYLDKYIVLAYQLRSD